jgi:hypothetical protein
MAAPPPLSAPERKVTTAPSQPPIAHTVGHDLVRATWIPQAACALPTLFVLVVMTFVELFQPLIPLYDFTSVSHPPISPSSYPLLPTFLTS